MGNSKKEVGINIVKYKENGNYYQSTIQYTFFQNIHSCTTRNISWLPISEKEAIKVIDLLAPKIQETDVFINWASKQELKADECLKKTIKFWEKINSKEVFAP